MSYAAVRTLEPLGPYVMVEIVGITPGSPPPRPHPEPPLGIWGPTDPRPTHPIAGIPGFPGYTPPGGGGGGGGGPVDPGYSPPWAQLPVDPGYGIPEGGYPGNPPRPTHPIMLPGMPGWGQPSPGPGPGTPPSPGPGVTAVVIPVPAPPEGTPPTPPPAGMPPDSVQVLIWFGPGTKPASAWVAPFASTGPVTPPAPATPA
jgi:hypothetical protein